MRDQKQRQFIARAVSITMATCGMAIGYFLGCALALELAGISLDQYSKLIAVQEDASSKEARDVLGLLKKSPYPFCSETEIAYFRELVFRSEYLKDAGRIHGGNIECSATAGHPHRAFGQFKAGPLQPDGTIAYSNLVPLLDTKLKRDGLQSGNAFVVFGSHLPAALGPIPTHLTINMEGAAGPATNPSNAPDLTHEGIVRVGDTLYATRCSALHLNCITSSASVSDSLRGEIGQVGACTILGGLAGALFGIVFSRARRRSLNLEQQLRRAIAQDKLQVAYQPIVSLGTGKVVGAEALARWTNEEGTPVSPDVFIKLAEEHGFVGSITRLVVRRALHDFSEILRNRPAFRLNVNVAAADLADPSFLPMLDSSLERAKVTPSSLAIEITESSTANREVAMESIRLLRRRGHSIYIDDFGTGYSSLSYLLYLSVDTIKIDKAFTRAIGTESVTVAILPQIMAMAKSLNLEVVVEGIETDQQALYFSTGTQRIYGQGWLYGRPISAEEFSRLLIEKGEVAAASPRVNDLHTPLVPALQRPRVA
jgi:sensor c-di-GMP phosphodiesterase-like protein